MKESTMLLIIFGIAGAGVVIALAFKKPSVYVGAGGNYQVTNISSSTGGKTLLSPESIMPAIKAMKEMSSSAPVQVQFPKLPRINNGDDAQIITSYIPGGY